MTECWEAQSQLRAGKASGAYPGGGGGTWLSQAEGAGATHSPSPSPAPQFLPSATFVAGKKRVAWNPWLSIMTLVGLQQLGWECPSQELDALKLRLSKLGVNCLNSPCFTECETMISCQVREKSGPALPGGWSIGRSNHCRHLWATLNRRAWGREEGPGMAILVERQLNEWDWEDCSRHPNSVLLPSSPMSISRISPPGGAVTPPRHKLFRRGKELRTANHFSLGSFLYEMCLENIVSL